jgi:hypothetical protein
MRIALTKAAGIFQRLFYILSNQIAFARFRANVGDYSYAPTFVEMPPSNLTGDTRRVRF